MYGEVVCPLCKVDLENSEHLLWSCDVLQDVWDALQVRLPPFESSLGSANKERWRPPDVGIIKLNFDASFIQEKRLATTTVLARDYKGEVVGVETYLFEYVADSFVAEARACERALIFTRKMCFQRLLDMFFDEVTYIFVPRAVNEEAHVLAMEGRRRGVCGIWVNGAPDSVQMVVRKDRLAWEQRILRRAFWLIRDYEETLLADS
ncbi:hypothetical protein Goarm_022609, partial [Gossypium armourianum]|nr:hypothetical protein [Gossypium armourianum]